MYVTKEIELVFIRQEKLFINTIAILTVIAGMNVTRRNVLECLKEATTAWYDAETENALACQKAAGVDVNILNLDMHGAFQDKAFRDILVSRHIKVASLQIVQPGDTIIPLDTPLFNGCDEDEEEAA